MSGCDSQENIRAYVRIRPSDSNVWNIEDAQLQQVGGDKQTYTVDRVFDARQSNETLYRETTSGLVKQVVLDGLNSTVFAYGQTSSGKTHSMRGTLDDPGLIPRAVEGVFECVAGARLGSLEDTISVTVSYMEIYNEEIRDLLADVPEPLVISSKRDGGVIVQGLSDRVVGTVEEVMALLDKGDAQRRVGETRMNARSSRSHAIFRLTVERGAKSRRSELTLVDLAGSERLGKTGAEGQRQKEGMAINKSLLVLGTVISKLSTVALGGTKKSVHVPYRDSKLTRVLQPALGGNAKTAIICAITPEAEHSEESHNSLMFACRAKTVVNDVRVGGEFGDGGFGVRPQMDDEAVKRVIKRKVENVTSYMLYENGPRVSDRSRRQSWSGIPFERQGVWDKTKRARRFTCSALKRVIAPSHGNATILDPSLSENASSEAAFLLERYKRDLETTRKELKRMMEEKGDVLPALKEAQWKNRQLEKDIERYKEEILLYKEAANCHGNQAVAGVSEDPGDTNKGDPTRGKNTTQDIKNDAYVNYELQIAELQACADAASEHIRYLEDKADEEARDRGTAIAELESRYEDKLQSMHKALRDLEDVCETSKLELDALRSESKALKEENDTLLKRIGMASGTLNALDELRDLKKKHRDEINKLNARIRSLTVGSKGNERATERAVKDSNRLKNHIQELEIKLKKAVAEKSALQSEKATLDREHRTAKASLEKLNKNADRAAMAEERRRQPILQELEETKSKLLNAEEEVHQRQEEAGKANALADELQQRYDALRMEAADLSAALEAERGTTSDLSAALETERTKNAELSASLESRCLELNAASLSLQEANKQVAKQTEELKGLKSSLEQGAGERTQLQVTINTLQQEKQILEGSLEAAETKAEMMDELELDLAAERSHIATMKKNFEVMEKGIEDHKRELAVLKKVVAEKDMHSQDLVRQLDESKANAAQVHAMLEAATIDIRKTKSLLSQAENAIEEHENTITEIHREKLDVEKSLDELEQEVNELRQEVANGEREKAELKGEVTSLEKELKTANQALVDERKSGNAKLDGMIEAQEAALQLKHREMDNARAVREALELEINTLRAENLEHALALEQLRSEHAAAATAAAEAKTSAEAASRAAKELQSSLEQQLHASHEELARTAIQATKTLEAERAIWNAALEKARTDAKAAADKASAEAIELRKNAEDMERELKASQTRDESVQASMRDTMRAIQSELDEANRMLEDERASVISVKSELENLKASYELGIKAAVDAAMAGAPSINAPNIQHEDFKERCVALESELRKSKRREEKLHALQYRLQMDFKESGGSLEALKNLRSIRELEFDLDRAQNQISRLRAHVQRVEKVGTNREPLETKNSNVI